MTLQLDEIARIDREEHPAWQIARIFPAQGNWSPEEYLRLTDDTNWMVEYKDGHLHVLDMPTLEHQFIVLFLYRIFDEFLRARKRGFAVVAPLRVKITDKEYREPDVIIRLKKVDRPSESRFLTIADLFIEVLSEGQEAHKRDFIEKKTSYAELGVPEYWVVNPFDATITVHKLVDRQYILVGVFTRGQVISPVTLEGPTVDVSATLDAGKDV